MVRSGVKLSTTVLYFFFLILLFTAFNAILDTFELRPFLFRYCPCSFTDIYSHFHQLYLSLLYGRSNWTSAVRDICFRSKKTTTFFSTYGVGRQRKMVHNTRKLFMLSPKHSRASRDFLYSISAEHVWNEHTGSLQFDLVQTKFNSRNATQAVRWGCCPYNLRVTQGAVSSF